MQGPGVSELEQLTQRLDEPSLAPAERAALDLALGRGHARSGAYDLALRHLVAARRWHETAGAEPERRRALASLDVDIGTTCVYKGEHDRGASYLQRAVSEAEAIGDSDLRARALAVAGDQALRRGELDRADALFVLARDHYEQFWDGRELSRCNGGLAAIATARGDATAAGLADRAIDDAATADDPLFLGRALLVRAEVFARARAIADARRLFRRAIALLQKHELRRELADAYLRFALMAGETAGETAGGTAGATAGQLGGPDAEIEPPAFWLARAQELLRDLGGLAELERVRDAFRRYGRRATDKVSDARVLEILQELKGNRTSVQQRAHRLSELAARGAGEDPSIHAELTGLEEQLARDLDGMALAEGRFLGAVNAVVVERENIRSLLELTRSLTRIADFATWPNEVARLASQLTGAERVAVAVVEAGQTPTLCGAYGLDHDAPARSSRGAEAWRATALEGAAGSARPQLVRFPDADRGDGDGGGAPAPRDGQGQSNLGQAIVAPLRLGTRVLGSIYADKALSGGVFTDRELDLLALFASHAATVLDNVRVNEELRLAARTTAATLEAIDDAVLSVDATGVIDGVNTAAVRVLGSRAKGRAARLLDFPALEPLRQAIARGEDLDGRSIELGGSEYLCNARVVRDDNGKVAGLVATLTEFKRASVLAQRIAGSTARYDFSNIVGRSPLLRRCLQLAQAAARSDSNVLITGESGTGKEVLAQAIHNGGPRAGGPFVALNCAAIPRDLLESELFGYEAGAFTGAAKGGRPGKFELAAGGTILLDEIGDMPIEMQVKLLRVLQERTAPRVGGSREIALDCRIIATTNRDLGADVTRGVFRQDLYFRLRVIHVELPPLRDRRDDIAFLTEHFLAIYSKRLGRQLRTVEPAVMEVMLAYAWPGNVRELEHVLESEVNLAAADQVSLAEVPALIAASAAAPAPAVEAAAAPPWATGWAGTPWGQPPPGWPWPPPWSWPGGPGGAPPGGPGALPGGPVGSGGGNGTAAPAGAKTISDSERELLENALTMHRGRIPEVARSLGVSRGTVYNKMKKFNLDPERFR